MIFLTRILFEIIVSNWKLLERSSQFFLKKKQFFRWRHKQEVIRIQSEIMIVGIKKKELICIPIIDIINKKFNSVLGYIF